MSSSSLPSRGEPHQDGVCSNLSQSERNELMIIGCWNNLVPFCLALIITLQCFRNKTSIQACSGMVGVGLEPRLCSTRTLSRKCSLRFVEARQEAWEEVHKATQPGVLQRKSGPEPRKVITDKIFPYHSTRMRAARCGQHTNHRNRVERNPWAM